VEITAVDIYLCFGMKVLVAVGPCCKDVLPDVGRYLGVKDCAIDVSITGVIDVMGPGYSNAAVVYLVPPYGLLFLKQVAQCLWVGCLRFRESCIEAYGTDTLPQHLIQIRINIVS